MAHYSQQPCTTGATDAIHPAHTAVSCSPRVCGSLGMPLPYHTTHQVHTAVCVCVHDDTNAILGPWCTYHSPCVVVVHWMSPPLVLAAPCNSIYGSTIRGMVCPCGRWTFIFITDRYGQVAQFLEMKTRLSIVNLIYSSYHNINDQAMVYTIKRTSIKYSIYLGFFY